MNGWETDPCAWHRACQPVYSCSELLTVTFYRAAKKESLDFFNERRKESVDQRHFIEDSRHSSFTIAMASDFYVQESSRKCCVVLCSAPWRAVSHIESPVIGWWLYHWENRLFHRVLKSLTISHIHNVYWGFFFVYKVWERKNLIKWCFFYVDQKPFLVFLFSKVWAFSLWQLITHLISLLGP